MSFWKQLFGGSSLQPDSALLNAAKNGDAQAVREALTAGANKDAKWKEKDDWTALHLAAAGGNASVVEILLKAGADKEAKELQGGLTPLHWAAFKCNAPVVEMLLKAGANVEAKSNCASTPLSWAAVGVQMSPGHVAVFELLLKAGANADAKRNDGKTPRDFVKQFGNTELVRLFATA